MRENKHQLVNRFTRLFYISVWCVRFDIRNFPRNHGDMFRLIYKTIILYSFCFSKGLGFSYICDPDLTNDSTPLDKLKSDMLCDYNIFKRPVKNPSTVSHVILKFIPIFFNIDEKEEVIHVGAYLRMDWTDEFLVWKPVKYNKITEFQTEKYYLWHPKISSYEYHRNAWYKFLNDMDTYQFEGIIVRSNGSITATLVATLNGPCLVEYSKWPFEEWQCKFTISGRGDANENTVFDLDPNTDIITTKLSKSKEWKITSDPPFEEYPDSDNIEVYVKLQRLTSHYQAVFITPGIVLLLLVLVSFWLTNKIYCRMFINMLSIVVQISFLQDLFKMLEEKGAGNIKIYDFYLDSLFASFMGLLFAAVDAKLLTKIHDPPQWMIELIGTFVALPYCGPIFSIIVNEDINSKITFEDDETGLVTPANNKINQKWNIIANFIDKIAFFVILLYFSVSYVV